MRLSDLEKIRIIAGFPGIGKTDVVKKNGKMRMKDSDSSAWDKKYFPENYLNFIEETIGDGYIILCSTHEDVRKGLEKRELDYILVYPETQLKEEYIQRYIDRGSPDEFISMMRLRWDEFIQSCDESTPYKRIKLKENQFLSDIITDLV